MVKYENKKWWKENTKRGDVITFKLKNENERSLIFERASYHNDYGEDMLNLVFQDTQDNLGNKRDAKIFHPEDVQVIKINDLPLKEYESGIRKERRRLERLKSNNSTSADLVRRNPANKIEIPDKANPYNSEEELEEMEEDIVPQKMPVKHGYDFDVKEINGRFICPCGNSYGLKGHAIWHHRNHVKRKQ